MASDTSDAQKKPSRVQTPKSARSTSCPAQWQVMAGPKTTGSGENMKPQAPSGLQGTFLGSFKYIQIPTLWGDS